MPNGAIVGIKIYMPEIFNENAFFELLQTYNDKIQRYEKVSTVIIDFAKLKRIEVGGIAVISNLIAAFRKRKNNVLIHNIDNCVANGFLKEIGFFDLYTETKQTYTKASREFLRLKQVAYENSVFYIKDTVQPWLASCFELNPKEFSSLIVVLEELFNNIKDHSDENIGCICGHFDQKNKTILMCICDFGVGIPNRIRLIKEYQHISDRKAIEFACKEGVSSKTTPRNRGVGLSVLIGNIVDRNSGAVKIYSGSGMLISTKDNGVVLKNSQKVPFDVHYPGTMIYITLSLNGFIPSEIDEEEFSWD